MLSALKDSVTPELLDVLFKKIYYRHVAGLPFDAALLKKVFKDITIYPRRHPRRFIKAYMMGELVDILHNLDRNTMAFSIEARDPFLDYRLAEIIYRMPFEFKIKGGWTKAVLRDGMNGILPKKIQKRKTKFAFVAPVEKWVNEDRMIYRKELEKALDRFGTIFDKKRVMDWFDGKKHFSVSDCNLIWRMVVSGRWANVFGVAA